MPAGLYRLDYRFEIENNHIFHSAQVFCEVKPIGITDLFWKLSIEFKRICVYFGYHLSVYVCKLNCNMHKWEQWNHGCSTIFNNIKFFLVFANAQRDSIYNFITLLTAQCPMSFNEQDNKSYYINLNKIHTICNLNKKIVAQT